MWCHQHSPFLLEVGNIKSVCQIINFIDCSVHCSLWLLPCIVPTLSILKCFSCSRIVVVVVPIYWRPHRRSHMFVLLREDLSFIFYVPPFSICCRDGCGDSWVVVVVVLAPWLDWPQHLTTLLLSLLPASVELPQHLSWKIVFFSTQKPTFLSVLSVLVFVSPNIRSVRATEI